MRQKKSKNGLAKPKQSVVKVGLEPKALEFWDLSMDPFIIGPLDRQYMAKNAILVHNDTIKFLDSIYGNIISEMESGKASSKITNIIGGRGSGKTTSLRYLKYKFEDDIDNNDKILPIFCSVTPLTRENNPGMIAIDVHKDLLSSLVEIAREKESQLEIKRLNLVIDTLNTANEIRSINNEIIYLIKEYYTHFLNLCIFIDDIDKYPDELLPTVGEYFSTFQGFYQKLTESPKLKPKRNLNLFITTMPGMKVFQQRQVSYFGDVEISEQKWSDSDIFELIDKRLRYVSTLLKSQYDLYKYYFTEETLEKIINRALYNPRQCMLFCKKLLNLAYQEYRFEVGGLYLTKRHKEEVKQKYRPIRKTFFDRYIDHLETEEEVSDLNILRRVGEEIADKHSPIINQLRICVISNSELRGRICQAIIDISQNYFSADKDAVDLLITHNLVTHKKGKCILNKELEALMGVLYDVIKNIDGIYLILINIVI